PAIQVGAAIDSVFAATYQGPWRPAMLAAAVIYHCDGNHSYGGIAMKPVRVVVMVCAVIALVVPAVRAQPPGMPKPGPEHERLKKLEGTWDATVKTEQGESKGTMIYKMDLGGLWMVSDFKGEFGGQKFQGKGFDGYDPMKKKYVSVWVDSMSIAPML